VIAIYLPTRPVYLIRNDPADLEQVAKRYMVSPIGSSTASNVFRVTAKAAAALPADEAGT
jgi:hypothetical protein